jgi:hypothetical protein
MYIHLAFPGKTPSVPRSVAFTFISQDITPRYNVNRHLVAEVDGGKVDLGEATLEQSRGENYSFNKEPPNGEFYVKEILSVVVPFETFLQLSQAKKLKLKLNKVDIPFSPCGIESLQNLASLVKTQ